MRKVLGIDSDMVYLDSWTGFELWESEEFFEDMEELIDYIKDHGEFELGNGWVSVITNPVRMIQYHFPTVNDDLEGQTPEEFLASVKEYVFEDIYFIYDGDVEINETDYEFKGENELKEAYSRFIESEDVDFLSKALEQFRKSNEHLYYLSPDALQRTIHKFIYKEIDSLNCELLPVLSAETIK